MRGPSVSETPLRTEADEAKWNRALEKLYAIMISSPGGIPSGVQIKPGHMDINLQQIRILCGSHSLNTVLKRANSLMKLASEVLLQEANSAFQPR